MATEEAHAQQQNKMWSPRSRSSRRWVGAVGGVEDAALFGWFFGSEVSSHAIASARHWPLAMIDFGVRLQKLANARHAWTKRQVIRLLRLQHNTAEHAIQNVTFFSTYRYVTSCAAAVIITCTPKPTVADKIPVHCYRTCVAETFVHDTRRKSRKNSTIR